ncbi:hypothetical protein B0H10DRAFT_2239844 [Mycena sp. CBHHK59/15]|nr:hypothetical protein B0H10DRAFT_2239844 [Mycena sp. CBHHK59/15]
MRTQSKSPSALIALHNFILDHDETDLDRWLGDEDALDNLRGMRRNADIDFGRLATAMSTTPAEKRRAEDVRDRMARAMFRDYHINIRISGLAVTAEDETEYRTLFIRDGAHLHVLLGNLASPGDLLKKRETLP